MSIDAPAGGQPSPIGDAALAGIDRVSAIEAVRLRIGTAIQLGLLRPGERLPDKDQVALGLSVSPITARRALTSLAEDGVVVRRRGRGGGTFVADRPPTDVLATLAPAQADFGHVHRLVDRRLLGECAVAHFAALNATATQIAELRRLVAEMAAAGSWSAYHQADERFHRLVAGASGLGAEVDAYLEALGDLYDYFIPYPIDRLHESNKDHLRLVEALAGNDVRGAVQIAHDHVDILHRTMFMGLSGPGGSLG
ncbi:FadR/GntR family transcriptional regulator [Specibacter cremeus]|uniref:FadR/GntR family transcriptional regulator n=1 Tax=Specibacter cremeus TaxID=1629051 RepID=UPI000F76E7D3|nr:FCD domain-containing protein [Specibacter cremeus]